jgi:hypothetical protein
LLTAELGGAGQGGIRQRFQREGKKSGVQIWHGCQPSHEVSG